MIHLSTRQLQVSYLAASEALLRLQCESALGPQMSVTANSLQHLSSSISIYIKSFMFNDTLQDALPGLTLS